MKIYQAGQEISEALSKIVHSDYLQKLMPSLDEMNENMARMVYKNKYWHPIKIDGFDGNSLEKGLHDIVDSKAKLVAGTFDEKTGKKINKVVENMNLRNVDESFEKLYKYAKKDEDMTKKIHMIHDEVNQYMNGSGENIESTIGVINYAVNLPRAYFNSADKSVRHARAATAVGAYAGVTVGGRLISGGTLTEDSYGKKDIAGVPFI